MDRTRETEKGKAREKTREKAKEKAKEAQQPVTGQRADGIAQEPSAAAAYIQNAGKECILPDPGIPDAMASPTVIHQTAALEIIRQIADCIEEHDAPCFAFIAPSDVPLGNEKKTVVQPDIYVHCMAPEKDGREKKREAGPHHKSPDYIVEILSPSNPENDLWRKRELYQRHGVREYWIIDPLAEKVYVFRFDNEEGTTSETMPDAYSFRDKVPIGISQGSCAVDFQKIRQKLQRLKMLEGY